MPIRIANDLPAKGALENENIFVMTENRADTQDIRPLKIVLLNLMPTKIETETQFLRLLSNTPLQIDIELLQTATHRGTHVSSEHLIKFYKTFNDIRDRRFDGMIVTGAPVEQLEFEDVDYWDELCCIFDWADKNVYSSFHVCWGAQAGLYHRYGLKKYPMPKKISGVFKHIPLDLYHPLMRGFDDGYRVPHSRYTETHMDDIAKIHDLQVLSYSEEAGVQLISDMACRNFYSTGHWEYDRDTLAREYRRDIEKGLNPEVPAHYFPNDDPDETPAVTWRSAGTLLFTNWVNYFVYQKTPYDLANL